MDVVVVGAGMVGAACAYFCAEAGLAVTVVDRGAVAGGTTSGGEGNILVSDKEPGAELDLALLSVRLWTELGERFGTKSLELQHKGGVVVAQTPAAADGLAKLAAEQRESGIDAFDVSAAELAELEPNLTREVCAGAYYPQDMQVQPMLAAAELLRQARRLGATVHTGTGVRGLAARPIAQPVTLGELAGECRARTVRRGQVDTRGRGRSRGAAVPADDRRAGQGAGRAATAERRVRARRRLPVPRQGRTGLRRTARRAGRAGRGADDVERGLARPAAPRRRVRRPRDDRRWPPADERLHRAGLLAHLDLRAVPADASPGVRHARRVGGFERGRLRELGAGRANGPLRRLPRHRRGHHRPRPRRRPAPGRQPPGDGPARLRPPAARTPGPGRGVGRPRSSRRTGGRRRRAGAHRDRRRGDGGPAEGVRRGRRVRRGSGPVPRRGGDPGGADPRRGRRRGHRDRARRRPAADARRAEHRARIRPGRAVPWYAALFAYRVRAAGGAGGRRAVPDPGVRDHEPRGAGGGRTARVRRAGARGGCADRGRHLHLHHADPRPRPAHR